MGIKPEGKRVGGKTETKEGKGETGVWKKKGKEKKKQINRVEF